MAANQGGGYHCRFVEQPKELQAECLICLCILREPQIVNCCGIKFCQVCINTIVVQNRPCPHCQARQFATMADKQLKRQLEERKVFCLNEQKGCKWKGEIKKLETHLDENAIDSINSCQFQDVPCPRCQQQVQRKGLQSHIKNVCQQRDVPCIYEYAGCKTKVRQSLMEAHLQNRALDHARYLSEHSQQLANDLRIANEAFKDLRGEIVQKGHLAKTKKEISKKFLNRHFFIALAFLILGSTFMYTLYNSEVNENAPMHLFIISVFGLILTSLLLTDSFNNNTVVVFCMFVLLLTLYLNCPMSKDHHDEFKQINKRFNEIKEHMKQLDHDITTLSQPVDISMYTDQLLSIKETIATHSEILGLQETQSHPEQKGTVYPTTELAEGIKNSLNKEVKDKQNGHEIEIGKLSIIGTAMLFACRVVFQFLFVIIAIFVILDIVHKSIKYFQCLFAFFYSFVILLV